MKVITTNNLFKKYKTKEAVKNLCISVEENELYSLLGLNGAGKTTTIKMLNGLISPTSGDATICGYSLKGDLDTIKAISSISPQESAISTKLTVYENIALMAEIHGMGKDEIKKKTDELIEVFKLEEYRNTYASKLSGGYQRRLSIAMALVSSPKILYLDEPTLGLDVLARRELWALIRKLKTTMTIILTTHYLEEVEALSDHIGIMKNGELLFEGDLVKLYEVSRKSNIEDAFIFITEGDLL